MKNETRNLKLLKIFITGLVVIIFSISINHQLTFARRDLGGGGGAAPPSKIECGVLNDLPGGISLCDKKGPNSFNLVIEDIATVLIGLIGLVLAIVIIVSALQIVASGGSPDAMKSAKNRLTQAAISLGLLISFRAIIALLGIN